MKITKKLAKEIFKGDFQNVDIQTLQKDSRAITRKFVFPSELAERYVQNEHIKPQDFENLIALSIPFTPLLCNGMYTLMTDVFTLLKKEDGYHVYITREKSSDYKGTEYKFDSLTKEKIKHRIISGLEFALL